MIGYLILGIIALFLAVVLIRTAAFNPKHQPETAQETVSFNKNAVIHGLAELVKCKTIS